MISAEMLYYLVERAKLAEHPERCGTMTIPTLSMAHPESIQVMDSDGNTLVLVFGARKVEPTSSKQISIAWLSLWCLSAHLWSQFPQMPRPLLLPVVGSSTT
jgi:hypothetical protein